MGRKIDQVDAPRMETNANMRSCRSEWLTDEGNRV